VAALCGDPNHEFGDPDAGGSTTKNSGTYYGPGSQDTFRPKSLDRRPAPGRARFCYRPLHPFEPDQPVGPGPHITPVPDIPGLLSHCFVAFGGPPPSDQGYFPTGIEKNWDLNTERHGNCSEKDYDAHKVDDAIAQCERDGFTPENYTILIQDCNSFCRCVKNYVDP